MYCYVVILRANKRDRELRRHCARHSSPLTFTSSTPDNGQILIQLGRINQITMTPCFLCLSRFVSSQLHAVRISIEHTSSWNNGGWRVPINICSSYRRHLYILFRSPVFMQIHFIHNSVLYIIHLKKWNLNRDISLVKYQ